MRKTRTLLSGLLAGLLSLSFVTPPASAGTASGTVSGIPIVGITALGKPTAARVSATIKGRTAYLRRFTKGQVFTSGLGNQTFTYPSSISLAGVVNERDALARYGFKKGVLLRTAKLSGATQNDKLKLATELRNGLIIDLRTKSKRVKYPDPALPKVTHLNIVINSDAIYSRYVTDAKRRAAFAKALRAAAAAKGSVLVHCSAGMDHTGWTIAMVMYAIGANDRQVMSEYLRTKGTTATTLRSGLKKAKQKYGSIARYLRSGLGLTATDIKKLKKKFA